MSLPTRWESIPFKDLCILSQNGCGARQGSGIPTVVLRLADVSVDGHIAQEGLRRVGLSEHERRKYALELGDLLAFRVNGSPSITGQMVCYSGPTGFAFCDHFISFRLRTDAVDPRFVAFSFRTSELR